MKTCTVVLLLIVWRPSASMAADLLVGISGGVLGVGGRQGWELWDSDVRYDFTTDNVRFGRNVRIAWTALSARRSFFLTHDFQVFGADHKMTVSNWQGPERLRDVRPGEQTTHAGLTQASSSAGTLIHLPHEVFLGAGGDITGFIGSEGWGLWGQHVLVQCGVASKRRFQCLVEIRYRWAPGGAAHWAEFTPSGYQIMAEVRMRVMRVSKASAALWHTAGGLLCWLPFLLYGGG